MLYSNTVDYNDFAGKVILPVCIVLMAFVYDPMVIDRQVTIRSLVLAICVTLCLLNLRIPKSNIMLFLLGYLLCSAISLFRAINPVEGLFEISRILLFFFALCVFSGKNYTKTIVLVGLVMAIYGIIIPDLWHFRTGTMGCRNQWSQALVLVLPFCVAIFKKEKILSVVSSVLILFNLFMLYNRTSILAIAVGCFVLALTDKRSRWVAIGFVVIAILVFDGNFKSMVIRYEFWQASLNLAKENLLFGVGVGNWPYEIIEWYGQMPNSEAMDTGRVVLLRPHNDYLLALCETGIMGFVYYIGIFVSGIYYSIKQKNRLSLVGITMFCTIAFFSFPKERPFLFFMLILYLSLLEFKTISYKTITLASIIIMLLICSHFFIYHDTERHIAKIQIFTRNRQWERVLSETDKCSRLNPNTLAMIPVIWYKSNAYLHLREYSKAIIYNDKAFKDNPNSIYVLDRMGCFFRIRGMNKEANMCFDRITSMVPLFTTSKSHSKKFIKVDTL